eukprot:jgi/Botrbrau1/4158/Bobra.0192s0026.1
MALSGVSEAHLQRCAAVGPARALAGKRVRMSLKTSRNCFLIQTNRSLGSAAEGVRCYAGQAAERLSLPEEPVWDWPKTFAADFDVSSEPIGKGSFGTVKRVIHRATQREAAVKIIPKSRKNAPLDRVLQRIREEVDFLEHVQERPEALQLLGVYEDEQSVYVVTELCKGGDLDALLKVRGHLTEWETAKVAHDILQVLCECHRQNICYADIKPANFLLKEAVPSDRQPENAPQVKVADFGCSQRVLQGEKLHKRTGTPLYMAPEIFMAYFGVESDMWSLGMMLYQCLAGHLPFWRSSGQRSPFLIMSAILSEEVPFEGPEWRHVSAKAIDFLNRLLDRDYNTRMSAAEALQHPWILEQCSLEVCQVEWDGNASTS